MADSQALSHSRQIETSLWLDPRFTRVVGPLAYVSHIHIMYVGNYLPQGLRPLTLLESLNTVFQICNYIQCSAWDPRPLTLLNLVHLYSFIIHNQIKCCAWDLWPLAVYKFLLNHCPRLLSCGNYTNIYVIFCCCQFYIYQIQFLISIKSLSQIAFIALCLETTLQTACYYFLFSFFSVVLGPLPLQSILYLLRVYFFRSGVSGPSASCILLKFS